MNENYQDFLSLGSSLHGGEEKVEEVRLGLLGFKRDVEGLRGKIEGRRSEVERLVDERKEIREQVQMGRALLDIDQRLQELEERLMIVSTGSIKADDQNGEEINASDSDSESDDEEHNGISTLRLRRHMQQYIYIKRQIARIGPDHPFLIKQEERVLRLKQTVLLDLGSALKQVNLSIEEDKERMMKILGIYRDMGEPEEALKVLRERRP